MTSTSYEGSMLDAVTAFVQRTHAFEAYKRIGETITDKMYHNMARDMGQELLQLRSLRLIENFDVKCTPFPDDPNDTLTTVIVRMGNRVHTAHLRMSHGIWLYKVWNTPLPNADQLHRIDAHAHEIVNAAHRAAKSSAPEQAIDLNDPASLKKHGITDLTQ